MSSTIPMSYFIEIEKNKFSYGFDFKDEGGPYRKYALVSRVDGDSAGRQGLKVGDKVLAVNGQSVVDKDYVALRNNLRRSLNNRVVLEVLNEHEIQLLTPEPLLPMRKKMLFEASKNIIFPAGNIKKKIQFFQNGEKNLVNENILNMSRSNSCGFLSEMHTLHHQTMDSEPLNSASLCSILNSMQDDNSLNSDLNSEIVRTVSQEPFSDDSIQASLGVIEILDSSSADRVLANKSNEHIKNSSLTSINQIWESNPEPFESSTIRSAAVPKIEISNFQSGPSISMSGISSKLVPSLSENISRSSTNIFEDASYGWSATIKNQTEFLSMTEINSESKKTTTPNKKLIKQDSVLQSIPIKLRIIQFTDKTKSKNWKDYILEKTENGARFRKRLESSRNDKTNNFEIKGDDINKFTIESPHQRQKNVTGADLLTTEFGVSKYDLITSNSQVHLKFYFNPSIFQDAESSSQAHSTYNEIIKNFMPHFENNSNQCLSESGSPHFHTSQSYENFTTIKETKISSDDHNSLDPHLSTSISYKAICKSSTENIPNNYTNENIPSFSKKIKHALDKIKPEKKNKSYEMFTGTKAEYEEFKKQLEAGILPLELDSIEKPGINFNKYIHEVPRMINSPKIPMIIYLCTEIVEKIGLQTEGIYRISGNQRVIKTLFDNLNKHPKEINSSLDEWNNVHAVCGTLKLFLRKLKQNLIPADLSHVLAYSCKAVDCDDPISLAKTLMDVRYHLSNYQNSSRRKGNGDSFKHIDDQLDCRWLSLQYLLRHLSKVVLHKQFNNMDEHALSICFNPVIMESWQKNINDIKADNEIMIKALELILIHQEWLFVDWNSHADSSKSSEVVENAYKYAQKFIDNKYDIKRNSFREIINNDVNVNKLVSKIINQTTMDFGEKRRLERRHSSHLPGERPCFGVDNTDAMESNLHHRNSKVTEALDLSTYFSPIKCVDKVPTIDENKGYTLSYILSDSHSEVNETNIIETKVTLRQSCSKIRMPVNCEIFDLSLGRHKSDESLNHSEKCYEKI